MARVAGFVVLAIGVSLMSTPEKGSRLRFWSTVSREKVPGSRRFQIMRGITYGLMIGVGIILALGL
jgi:hypothetical protein